MYEKCSRTDLVDSNCAPRFGLGNSDNSFVGHISHDSFICALAHCQRVVMPQVGGDPVQECAKVLINLLLLFGPCFSGFIVGLVSGFYAPAKDSLNPFGSQFYMDVAAGTLVFLVISIVVWMIAMELLLQFVTLDAVQEAVIVVPGYSVLFGLSLWLAINRALYATKLK